MEGFVDENAPIGTKVIDKNGDPIVLTVSDADLVSLISLNLIWSRLSSREQRVNRPFNTRHCFRLSVASVVVEKKGRKIGESSGVD